MAATWLVFLALLCWCPLPCAYPAAASAEQQTEKPVPAALAQIYKGKSVRAWLQDTLHHPGSLIGQKARETLTQFNLHVKGASAAFQQRLDDDDDVVRKGAIEFLRSPKRPKAVPKLLRMLREDPSVMVRGEAAHTLASTYTENPQVLEAVLQTIKCDPEARVRARAVEHLHVPEESEKKAVECFLAALKDRDPGVRQQAAFQMGKFGHDEPEIAVPALIAALKDDDEEVYRSVRHALTFDHTKAIAILLRALQDRDPFVRAAVAPGLAWALDDREVDSKTATEGLRALAQLLGDIPFVRQEVHAALVQIQSKRDEVILVFQEALKAKEPTVRLLAIEGLSYLKADVKPAMPALLAALKDPSARVRVAAAQMLSSLDPTLPGLLPVLMESATAVDGELRADAINALGELGPRAKAAVPAVRTALRAKDPELRRSAAAVLKAIDEEAAAKAGILEIVVDDVSKYLKDPNAPRQKGPIHFEVNGLAESNESPVSVQVDSVRTLVDNGGYTLRGKIDLSRIRKTTVPVQQLQNVEIEYTDDFQKLARMDANDIDGLIKQLYSPESRTRVTLAVIPGGETLSFPLPVKRLIQLGAKARPAVQAKLGDPRVQNEVALILGAIGDESSVAALIDAYPRTARAKKSMVPKPPDDPMKLKIICFTYALTYLTGQPIGRSRWGTDCNPDNPQLWEEWWSRARKTFRVPTEKYNASCFPHYPDLSESRMKKARGMFASQPLREP
jgi:HEAT repeat protein